MEHLAPILQAFASLAWASFAFVALFMFKPEITRALGRIKKGKFLGQEFELGDELMYLEKSAAAIAKEAQQLPADESRKVNIDQEEKFDAIIRSIIQQASNSPKAALMALSAELEKQSLHGLAIRGMLRGRHVVSISHALSELGQYGLPQNLQGSLELFNNVRNKIIHGGTATEDDALRALDSGMTILRALKALPHEINVVYHPDVEVFSDDKCTKPIPGVKGIILETTSPGGVTKTKRIYATTQTHFQKGKEVAWEWNTNKKWSDAWYRDPETKEIKYAWGGCAEFIGRHLDDISDSQSRM